MDALAGETQPTAEARPPDDTSVALGTLPGRGFGAIQVGALPRGCLGVSCHCHLRASTQPLHLFPNSGGRGARLLKMPRHDLAVLHGWWHVLLACLNNSLRGKLDQTD